MSDQRSTTRRIREAVKDQIRQGAYPPGARLPSTRGLAAEWGVSRTTVTAAYAQLIAEGYLDSRQGARAVVVQGVGPEPEPRQAPSGPPSRLSAYARRLADLPGPNRQHAEPTVADFRYGDLASADFPAIAWRKAVSAALLRRPARLRYGDPAGSGELRAALQGYLWRARGLRCDAGQIVVVNGSQQGIDLCARLLLDSGDRVIVENPCYAIARQTFAAVGAVPVPVDVDGDGMRTHRLPEARLAYVTPSHQFPLGSVLSAARRRELLAWARRNAAYVIEDDYDGEYRYDINPVPALQALDGDGAVIYLGTVSKTLSPTLRLGYLVLPAGLRDVFAKAKQLADRQTPAHEQQALTDFIASGAYERHIRKVRRKNAARRAALLAALSAALGDRVTIAGAEAGLHVVVWLNGLPKEREAELLARAASAGVGIYPVSPSYDTDSAAAPPGVVGLVMGYASLGEREIGRGVTRLAEVLWTLPGAAGPAA